MLGALLAAGSGSSARAQGASAGKTVTAVGLGQVNVDPKDRHNNASIVEAVEAAEAKAIPQAVQSARERATKLAQAGGLTLGALQSVEEVSSAVPVLRPRRPECLPGAVRQGQVLRRRAPPALRARLQRAPARVGKPHRPRVPAAAVRDHQPVGDVRRDVARPPPTRDDAHVSIADTREHQIAPVRDKLFALIDERVARTGRRWSRISRRRTCGGSRPMRSTSLGRGRCSARSTACSLRRRAAARTRSPCARATRRADEDGYEPHGSVVETNTEDWPFLVDSVSAELQSHGARVQRVLHPIVGVERDGDGRISAVLHPREASTRESVMHFDLDQRLPAEKLADVEAGVRDVLERGPRRRARLPGDGRPRRAG